MANKNEIIVVHYWGGEPLVRTSRFDWHYAILNKCRQKGWRSVIVFSSAMQNEEIQKVLTESNIECLYVSRPRGQFDLRCIYDSYKLFKDIKCAIAHFHCVHTSPIIGSFLAGVPIRVWSCHSSEYRDDGQALSWMHRFGVSNRVTSTLAHKILPVSESIRKELLHYGIPENRMSLAPIPIDISRYRAKPQARAFIRKSLGYTENELLVCSIGRAIYRKGWDILIRAFARVSKQLPQMRLLLIGAIANSEIDSYQKSLFQLADELRISDKVNFLGVRNDVADILSSVDIFALPSRAEGLPIALLEAMASGLPCIALSVSGIPEVIRNEENGFLVEGEDVNVFADGLARLAANKELRRELSEKSLLSVKEFSLEYQVENVLKIYNGLLAERGLGEGKV